MKLPSSGSDGPLSTTSGAGRHHVRVPRLPNLLVIGVSKAGTTSLFDYLGRHPDISQADHKELRYFTPLTYGDDLAPAASYAAHFTGSEPYAMEATPGYFNGGGRIARAIHNICPADVVAILSLREPGARCWSWYRFQKSRTRIPKDLTFTEYLDRCERQYREVVNTPENQAYRGLSGGCYDEHLDEWIDEFGDALKVVFFDDLVNDPWWLMEGLFDWLGLDSSQSLMAELEAENKTTAYRNRVLQQAALAVNRRGEGFFRRYPRLKRRLRAGYYALNKAEMTEEMTPAERERLTEFFRPHNQRLAQQLARIDLKIPAEWPS